MRISVKLATVVLPWALTALAACSTTTHVLTGTPREPIRPENVKVYAAPPPGSEEIALISGTSHNTWAITEQGQMDAVVEKLREKAAKLGANGIVFKTMGDGSNGGAVVATSSTTAVYAAARHKVGSAAAIYVPKP